jgi:hypothetical protein
MEQKECGNKGDRIECMSVYVKERIEEKLTRFCDRTF